MNGPLEVHVEVRSSTILVDCCMLIVPHYPAPTCTNTPHFWPAWGTFSNYASCFTSAALKALLLLPRFHIAYTSLGRLWDVEPSQLFADIQIPGRPNSLSGTDTMYSTCCSSVEIVRIGSAEGGWSFWRFCLHARCPMVDWSMMRDFSPGPMVPFHGAENDARSRGVCCLEPSSSLSSGTTHMHGQ